jgi:hypothetical protein
LIVGSRRRDVKRGGARGREKCGWKNPRALQPSLEKMRKKPPVRNRRSLGIDRVDSLHLAVLVAVASNLEARIRAQKEPWISPVGLRQLKSIPIG